MRKKSRAFDVICPAKNRFKNGRENVFFFWVCISIVVQFGVQMYTRCRTWLPLPRTHLHGCSATLCQGASHLVYVDVPEYYSPSPFHIFTYLVKYHSFFLLSKFLAGSNFLGWDLPFFSGQCRKILPCIALPTLCSVKVGCTASAAHVMRHTRRVVISVIRTS